MIESDEVMSVFTHSGPEAALGCGHMKHIDKAAQSFAAMVSLTCSHLLPTAIPFMQGFGMFDTH
ncbi:hypothetical protein [Pseudomonas izuensis]|uniref:hypothetical protein n=1 Tax=Pseudomonas izuensis TaxID=2684212 RepID=UPI001356AE3E|nr:hypothetical protein [Pseudomonas izuensis]